MTNNNRRRRRREEDDEKEEEQEEKKNAKNPNYYKIAYFVSFRFDLDRNSHSYMDDAEC